MEAFDLDIKTDVFIFVYSCNFNVSFSNKENLFMCLHQPPLSSFHTYALPCALDPVPAVYSSVDHHFYQFALSPHYPAHVPCWH